MNNSIVLDILSHQGRLSAKDIEKLVEEAERYYEDDKEVDLRGEIESYASHNGTKNESTEMRLVENDST
jgi:molecular chaperone DnaK (HSP70)